MSNFLVYALWTFKHYTGFYPNSIAFTICTLGQPATHTSEWYDYFLKTLYIFLFRTCHFIRWHVSWFINWWKGFTCWFMETTWTTDKYFTKIRHHSVGFFTISNSTRSVRSDRHVTSQTMWINSLVVALNNVPITFIHSETTLS